MSNTVPIPELLAREVVRRLSEITTADGYNFTATEVVRPNRDGSQFNYRHLSIRVDQASLERIEDMDCPGNPPAIAWALTFEIRGFCRNTNQGAEFLEAATVNPYDMQAAIERAIVTEAADSSTWYRMGTYCWDTRRGPVEYFQADDGEYHGVMVPITCLYRVSETNPFESRA